jgi:hypothetical protein
LHGAAILGLDHTTGETALAAWPAAAVKIRISRRSAHRSAFMSSGMVSLDTWRERLMPMLAARARTLLAA